MAAPGGTGSPGAVVPGSGGTAGSDGAPELGAYARRLYQVVGRQRRYPASAARFGMEGTARIHLSIHRDGSLAGAPRLVRSSGHEVLDAEALRMVEAAAPFEPLPEGHARPSAEFVIPVDFSLRTPR
jgi:protein TonB